MKIRATLSRDAYLRLAHDRVTLSSQLKTHTLEDEREVMAKRYPCPTPALLAELRSRGCNANESTIKTAIRHGVVAGPESKGKRRYRLWTMAEVDALVDWCEREQILTPSAWACFYFQIDPEQLELAERRARVELPQLAEDQLVMELTPCVPGIGLPREVSYRQMTVAEAREFAKRATARIHEIAGQ